MMVGVTTQVICGCFVPYGILIHCTIEVCNGKQQNTASLVSHYIIRSNHSIQISALVGYKMFSHTRTCMYHHPGNLCLQKKNSNHPP